MKGLKQFLAGFAAGLAIMILIVGIYGLRSMAPAPDKAAANDVFTPLTKEKMKVINDLIDLNYLNEVDPDMMTESMFKGYIAGLNDVYAAYYTKEEFDSMMESTNGSYSGIGMIMTQDPETGLITVVGTYEGYGAEKAGMKEGDVLVRVDEMDCTQIDISLVASGIRNAETETVHVTWSRNGELMEADVEKSTVDIPVVYSEMMDGQIGYIQLTQFTATGAQHFIDDYHKLEAQGMKALIVDLRNNPGGLMDSVIEILNSFMPEGLMVYMEKKNGTRKEYLSKGETPMKIPMAVLVNENSASASEIFAGAVQYYQMGTLVGTNTFGKGIVQQTFPIGDGTAVKMTIANYYTPGGICIQGTGIEPDILVEQPPYEEPGEDEEPVEPKDLQLEKALELLKSSY